MIAERYLLFFSKFHSHRVKNGKVMTKNLVTAKCARINDGASSSTAIKCLDLIENAGVLITSSSPAKQYFVT